jgi:hypothetical protein
MKGEGKVKLKEHLALPFQRIGPNPNLHWREVVCKFLDLDVSTFATMNNH